MNAVCVCVCTFEYVNNVKDTVYDFLFYIMTTRIVPLFF